MSIVGKSLGFYLGVKLINGKLKPKFGVARYFGLGFFGMLILISVVLLFKGLTEFNVEFIVMSLLMGLSSLYLILISPIAVKDVSVIIEEGGVVKVYHKDKEVIADLVKDDEGKFNFAKPNDKHNCVRYADGSKISSFNQYRVVNYLSDALHTNGLLSEDVRFTLE